MNISPDSVKQVRADEPSIPEWIAQLRTPRHHRRGLRSAKSWLNGSGAGEDLPSTRPAHQHGGDGCQGPHVSKADVTPPRPRTQRQSPGVRGPWGHLLSNDVNGQARGTTTRKTHQLVPKTQCASLDRALAVPVAHSGCRSPEGHQRPTDRRACVYGPEGGPRVCAHPPTPPHDSLEAARAVQRSGHTLHRFWKARWMAHTVVEAPWLPGGI